MKLTAQNGIRGNVPSWVHCNKLKPVIVLKEQKCRPTEVFSTAQIVAYMLRDTWQRVPIYVLPIFSMTILFVV